jgi:hypothetical protein
MLVSELDALAFLPSDHRPALRVVAQAILKPAVT